MASKKKSNKNDSHNYLSWGIGFGITAATAAGAYFLYGTKEGAKRRAKIKGWTLKMKGDVLDKLEKAKEVNEDKYNEIVDTVTEKYARLKSIDPEEVRAIGEDLKKHWKNIKKHLEEGGGKKGGRSSGSGKSASGKSSTSRSKSSAKSSGSSTAKKTGGSKSSSARTKNSSAKSTSSKRSTGGSKKSGSSQK